MARMINYGEIPGMQDNIGNPVFHDAYELYDNEKDSKKTGMKSEIAGVDIEITGVELVLDK